MNEVWKDVVGYEGLYQVSNLGRVRSVDRVLDFIRSEYKQGRLCNLDTLLCHCQNKLNGNIDGIELTLGEGKPFEILKVGDSE